MDRQKLVEILANIEKELPVHTWVYKGIQYWPILKRDIFFEVNYKYINKHLLSPKLSRFKLLKRFQLLFESVVLNISFCIRKNLQKDILYFGADTHRLNYENKRINRYYYPQENENYMYIEYGGVKSKLIYPKEYFDFEKASFIYKLYYRFCIKNDFIDVANRQRVFDILNFFPIEIRKDVAGIIKNEKQVLSNILAYSNFIEKLFLKTQPEEILGLCYYNTQMFAVHYTANKMRIKNTDIQHGAQGKMHVMYFFENFHEKGFNTLPQNFWVWDKPSENNIKSWLSENNFHSCIEKGNPWIQYINEKEQKVINSSKKIILYTLQQEFLDDYILDAIAQTTERYEWWLRFHPTMKNSYQNIKEQLHKYNLLHKVNINDANEFSLPIILKEAYIHISKFSGSIIEAEQLDVKTIILEGIGVKTFEEYIKWGNCVGITNPSSDKIMEIIK